MANLARFSTLDTALDDLMRGFFVRPMNYEPAAPVQMKVDVTENENGYLVRAEIPGVKKEDIHVEVDGERRPVLRADLLFRGVETPPGEHRITFTYRPFSRENLVAAAREALGLED